MKNEPGENGLNDEDEETDEDFLDEFFEGVD